MKKILKIIGIGILLGFLLYGLDLIFRISAGKSVTFNVEELLNIVYYIFYTLPLTLINFFFYDYLNHQISWEKYDQRYRIIIGFFGSVVITIGVLFLLRVVQNVWFEGNSYSKFIENEHFEFYFTSIIVSLVISITFHAFYFYRWCRRRR